MMKYMLVLAVALGVAASSAIASAQEFGGHRRPSIGMSSCWVVANSTQRAAIKQQFQSSRQKLITDHHNLMTQRQALTAAILSGTSNVSAQEGAVISAQQQLLQDQDAVQVAACSQLSPQQLTAAQTLHNTLLSLRRNSRQQMHAAFQAARSASGASPTASPSAGQ